MKWEFYFKCLFDFYFFIINNQNLSIQSNEDCAELNLLIRRHWHDFYQTKDKHLNVFFSLLPFSVHVIAMWCPSCEGDTNHNIHKLCTLIYGFIYLGTFPFFFSFFHFDEKKNLFSFLNINYMPRYETLSGLPRYGIFHQPQKADSIYAHWLPCDWSSEHGWTVWERRAQGEPCCIDIPVGQIRLLVS